MTKEYYSLENVERISFNELVFARSNEIYNAIKQHCDYSLIEICRYIPPSLGVPAEEIFIVEISCDGVPSNNNLGIDFIERLAICVPRESKKLVEVFALRKNFPLLMHQNSVLPGMPPSLCLYQESPRNVFRTWTAPSFLKRIQYWLEHSARGTLHPDDQPVEQLFFTSEYELILPWNFDELQNTNFFVRKTFHQKDKGVTLFLSDTPLDDSENIASIINITLPPVVHGRIESDFGSLGQLSDTLMTRGINLVEMLSQKIEEKVGNGISVSQDAELTVILMQINIIRSSDDKNTKVFHKAYLVSNGELSIGENMGVLYRPPHDNQMYYVEQKASFSMPNNKDNWRNILIWPMEILRCLDRSSARSQSGIKTEGPSGTLIGAGALGSALLDLWTRSGWGEWDVIDNDHIKPHNLVRHQANVDLIGANKAVAAIYLVNRIMAGAAKGEAINADACELTDTRVTDTLRSSQLIVDASTTLDYPRIISGFNDFSRHLSVFVTPNANAGVLLLEDVDRKKRLRTIEAQYYRAILSEKWGENHLAGNRGTYWSGASCRDISLVMPYSNIVKYASIFAEQMPLLIPEREAAIRIWQADSITGAIAAYSIEVREELCLPFDSMNIYIDVGIQEKMHSQREASLPKETGGVLLGYYDFNINAIVVVDALPAPKDSKASTGYFERGLHGVVESVVKASQRTAGIVGYIGEWHSHPRGADVMPSNEDKFQLAYLTQGLAEEGLPAVMLIIGDDGLCVLQGNAK